MTDRMAALERVAEAARAWNHAYSRTIRGAGKEHRKELSDAIDALDALPAEPVGETVEVRAVVKRARGTDIIHVYGRSDLTDTEMVNWAPGNEVVAFTTARVPLPTIPTIEGSVTP